MRVSLAYLVINSPQDTGYNYGLGYVAAVLRQGGHDVDYTTLTDARDVQAFCEHVGRRRPGIVGLSATTAQFGYANEIARAVKTRCDGLVVCGGVHPTLRPTCLVEADGLDAIARGEGEYTMLALADALERGDEIDSIAGLWLRRDGAIVENPTRPFIEDLNGLPLPDKACLDYQSVIDRAGGVNRFVFSRGCTFRCTYCSNRALSAVGQGRYFRQQSPARAIDEIRRDRERFRFSRIVIDDDTITLRKDWFYAFFERYRREFDVPFGCNLRVGTVDEEMVRLLAEAGCDTVAIGVEHGNETFRRTVLKRPMTNRQIVETFEWCHRHGLATFGQAIVGFPYEDERLFLDTVRLCRRLSIRNPISIFQPYPATELGEVCARSGWLPAKASFRERKEAVIDFPGFSREQIQRCADVFPVVTQHRWIPLSVPLSWTLRGYRAVNLGVYLTRRLLERVGEIGRTLLTRTLRYTARVPRTE